MCVYAKYYAATGICSVAIIGLTRGLSAISQQLLVVGLQASKWRAIRSAMRQSDSGGTP